MEITIEQIQKVVEDAISQGVSFPWWAYIHFVFLSGLCCFLAVYLRRKGENLATKEDISEITDKVESVKHTYAKENYKFQVACSGLLQKRAEAIEELYHLIVDIEEIFGRFVDFYEWKNDKSKQELRTEGCNLLFEFLRKYKKSRIYFNESTCDKLKLFLDSIYKTTIGFSAALTFKNEEPKNFTNQWAQANEDYNKIIPNVRLAIEEEFRQLLNCNLIATTSSNK
jgi:hypothetical protein